MKLNLSDKSNQRSIMLFGVLLLCLAGWIGFGAFSQWQNERKQDQLIEVRDAAIEAVQQQLQQATDKLKAWSMQDDVQQAALRAPNSVPELLKEHWSQLQEVRWQPADVMVLYRDLEQAGFGHMAVTEQALSSDAAAARVIKSGDAPVLMLAVALPVANDGRRVLLASLPVGVLEDAFNNAVDLPSGAYLALRQGGYTVIEKGNRDLSEQAEARGRHIEASPMRMAAASPSVESAAFGLSALKAIIVTVLLTLAGLALIAFGSGKLAGLFNRKDEQDSADDDGAMTLGQIMAMERAPAEQDWSEDDAGMQMFGVEDDEGDQRPAPVSGAYSAEPSNIAAAATGAAMVGANAGQQIPAHIFRAYDIRGIVGTELNHETAIHIGQAIGSLMAESGLPSIVVGRDGRLSGPDLSEGLIEGLLRAGRDVVDIGVLPTPAVYFATYELGTGCGVAVTGSHNPADYNGFKIVVGGVSVAGDALQALYQRIVAGNLFQSDARGTRVAHDIRNEYVQRIASDVQLARPLKVVVDAGNGVAGELGPAVLQAIGADVIPLYCDIDGTFPNHHPDPSEPHNLADLMQTVRQMGADLGIAFDGDGDRLGVVTTDGKNIFPDRLLMLFADDVLERNPGAMIIYDVKCTGRIEEYVLMRDGSPLMWKTGHSLIKAKMRETGAELAGEMSGHFFFAERWYGFDDGIYAAARLLEILSKRPQTPNEVLNALPAGVSTAEIKVPAPGGDPHRFVAKFQEQAQFDVEARQSRIDGLRVDWEDGWGLLRASNTTPVLVLRFDANNEAALQRIQAIFRGQLLALDASLKLPF